VTADPEFNQLRWRCRRGMRELDTLLMAWLEGHYRAASAVQRAAFRDLLSMPDPEILGLLTRRLRSDDERIEAIVGDMVGKRLP
jgi:antitoxin CptB